MNIKSKLVKKYKGFTLVELIVVITILVILGTIGFIQLQGFTGSARDSARIENLSNLHKGLSLFNVTSGTYPMPEGPVTITASGTDIGYQGFAKDLVGGIAKLSVGATKDPLDPSIYTTYSVSKNQTKMQLMAFLEDGSQVTAFVPNAYASVGSDYSKRSPLVRGDTLGILLASGSLQPVQESGMGVDVVNTTGSYIMQFDKDTRISGSGVVLKSGIAGGGLVGYWSFDEGTGTIAYDKSGKGNNGVFSGMILPSWSPGKNGNGISFLSNSGVSSLSGAYIEFGQLKNMFATSEGTPHTIVGWIYIPHAICTDTNTCRQWVMLLGSPGSGSHHWLVGGFDGPSQFGVWSGPQVNTQYNVGKWMFIAMSFDGRNLVGYMDDKKISSNIVWNSATTFNLKDSSFSIGGKIYGEAAFDGLIDELRIYNRALSDSEIQTLYNATK